MFAVINRSNVTKPSFHVDTHPCCIRLDSVDDDWVLRCRDVYKKLGILDEVDGRSIIEDNIVDEKEDCLLLGSVCGFVDSIS
jgi:hypothetical protein